MKILTNSPEETENIGIYFAKICVLQNGPVVVALKGDLGSGKTTFVKGFAKGLEVKEQISSPTFVIFKKYKTNKHNLYHFDAYRIEENKEMLVLGFSEIISSENSVVIIEWSENIEDLLPQKRIELTFKHISPNKRVLIISGISDKMENDLRARGSVG